MTLPDWIEGVVFIEEDGAKRILRSPEIREAFLALPRNRQSREVGKLAAKGSALETFD